ncbi:amidohydrolase family protein [Candidatus Latescibacterota bacterium]
MNDLQLFDCDVMLGRIDGHFATYQGGLNSFETVEELETALDKFGVKNALVYSSWAKFQNTENGNDLLAKSIKSKKNLYPCFIISPEMEFDKSFPETFIRSLRDNNVSAVKVCPTSNYYELEQYVMNDIFNILNKIRMPVFIDHDTVKWQDPFNWSQVYALCRKYPQIPFIPCRHGRKTARNVFPIMKECDNLYLDISYFQLNRAIEVVADKFGAERMIFGTGMPVFDPRLPITGLVFSQLSDKEKALVASGNIKHLIGRVDYSKV